MRVLYSFPHPLGQPGIGTTAWNQVQGILAEGCDVTVVCSSFAKRPAGGACVSTLTLLGRRLPHRLFGVTRAYRLHDRAVARLLRRDPSAFDVVHCWPLGSLETLRTARELGVPAVLERPNAHTAFAYDVSAKEHERLGIAVQAGSSHAPDPERLEREEQEYALATRLLVPSEFVAETFVDRGVPRERLLRHRYGYDPSRFRTASVDRPATTGTVGALRVAFVGRCEPRKGLHLALEAWQRSAASRAPGSRFVICGRFLPAAYRDVLAPELLAQPTVDERGFVGDPSAIMRASDVFVLPSLEEGSALVTYEARACGCVLLVSEASGAVCRDGEDALVHAPGDVAALAAHFDALAGDPERLAALRRRSLAGVDDLTWAAAARTLVSAYASVVGSVGDSSAIATADPQTDGSTAVATAAPPASRAPSC